MRILWLTVLVGLYTADLSALTITTRITSLGSNSYRETFVIEDFTISFGQALEIRYPAALFGSLRDVRRPATKSGMLLFPLPDSIGGERIYFVQALLDQAGPVTFTLEFTYLGAGEPPGVHPYRVLDFPNTLNVIASGFTSSDGLNSYSPKPPIHRAPVDVNTFSAAPADVAGLRQETGGRSANTNASAPVNTLGAAININISSLVNSDLTTYTGGGNYPQHGGTITVAGIPFTLATMGQNADTAVIQSSLAPGAAQTYSMPIGIFAVTSMYTLINSAGGACGATIGELDFIGLVNSFTYPLIEGTNVRDHFNGGFCNTANAIAGTEAFGGGADRLDMQQINLPASFATDTLQRIDFKSFGQGLQNGAPFLTAVTLFQALPSILLPSNVAAEPGQPAAFPVALSQPAGADGVFVTLVSSDPSKVSLGPPNSASTTFFIPPGATTSSRSLYVYGVDFGTAAVTGSAMGYSSSAQSVRVAGSEKFVPGAITIFGPATQKWISLDLSTPAPPSGLTIMLASENPSIANVPANITMPAGTLSTVVPVTSGAFGATTIHASSPVFLPDASAQVTVAPALAVSTTTLPNGKIGVPYSAALSATGGTPPYIWALTSGALEPGLTLNPATGQLAGTPTTPGIKLPLLFTVTDSSAPAQTAQISLTLTML